MVIMSRCKGKCKGRGHLILRLFVWEPYHRNPQIWHALSKDPTVLPVQDVLLRTVAYSDVNQAFS